MLTLIIRISTHVIAAVACCAFGTWASSGDLPDLIHLQINPPPSRRDYRNQHCYIKAKYNVMWHYREKLFCVLRVKILFFY